MPIKAIVFGGIGTLVETSELQRKSFNRAFEEADLDWHWDADTYRKLLDVTGGRNRIRHYASLVGDSRRIDEVTIAWLHECKSALFVEAMRTTPLRPRPGVVALIDQAKGAGLRLAMASTTAKENIHSLMFSAGLDPHTFDLVLHAGHVRRGKPDPEVYTLCLQELGIDPENAIAIEDSEAGVSSAASAGVSCIAIPGANTANQNYDQATLVLRSLNELGGLDALQDGGSLHSILGRQRQILRTAAGM